MGANAQTSVPAFVTGQVLTAQQQTEINTGIPVFADSSARDAAFGNSGEKTLAEGQYAYLEDTNATQFYDGSTWQAVGVNPGLVFIQSTSSLSTSFSMNDVFSSTYDNYRIILAMTSSDTNLTMRLRVGGTDNSAASYQRQRLFVAATTVTGARTTGATSWTDFLSNAGKSFLIMDVISPFLAESTGVWLQNGYNSSINPAMNIHSLNHSVTSSFDGFTITSSAALTGTCTVFGYSKS